jgi:GTP-binding protein Era
MNRLVGEKVAIVSPKPQTTRDRINGIRSDERSQIIFVDMPGLVEPRDRLNEALVENIRQALDGVDVVIHLIDVTDPEPMASPAPEILDAIEVPVLAAINKIDRVQGGFELEKRLAEKRLAEKPGWIEPGRYEEVFPISATDGRGLDALLGAVFERLPEGPPLYDPEELTDRDLRWLSGEIVREKVFLLLGEELPYSIAVETEEFREREDGKWFIRVVIYVERESQKGIVIGSGGQMLKEIGQAARGEVEALVGMAVYLELWVKVRKNWRKKENELRRFGYVVQGKERRR